MRSIRFKIRAVWIGREFRFHRHIIPQETNLLRMIPCAKLDYNCFFPMLSCHKNISLKPRQQYQHRYSRRHQKHY